jgi:hypothetical protein
VDAAESRRELQGRRQAALLAAAALIGPTVPGGIVDRHPDEAATAVVWVAELFLPWLLDGSPLPVPGRVRKREAAATAARPGTGVEHGPEGSDSEED